MSVQAGMREGSTVEDAGASVPSDISSYIRGQTQQATELALLEQGMREIYHKLHQATSSPRDGQTTACLTKHEAAEVLKLLQAATRK